MSDALPLPQRPSLQYYRKIAKAFQRACNARDETAVRAWAARCIARLSRAHGIDPDREAMRVEHRWRTSKKGQARGRCSLSDAQLFVAREHGFASWPKFAAHVESVSRRNSPVSHFEKAVDAIVAGDAATLTRLLRADPKLTQARSTRDHRSTLLHYVSANGVEDFRQKTPANIVEIARLLLDAGADVNAESDAYGGHSTALNLTATSWHPEHAGVQLPLLQLLIDRGAAVDGPEGGSDVNACLHNGRGMAAEFLADRGGRLDLEGAAGVGRLEVVRSFFDGNGRLKPTATPDQLTDGFTWACEFGRVAVVEFLLERGANAGAALRHDGQTGLHWAAIGGHAGVVSTLLKRGARVDVRDRTYGGTPLQWALYGWGNSAEGATDRERYYEVVALLVRAGAGLDAAWYEEDDERRRAWRRMQSDPRMAAALRGEMLQSSPRTSIG